MEQRGLVGEIIQFSPKRTRAVIRTPDGRDFRISAKLLAESGISTPTIGQKFTLRLRRSDAGELIVQSVSPYAARTRAAGGPRSYNRSGDPSKLRVRRKIQDFEKDLLERRARQSRILILGRTGVGKSSTINSVLGVQVAEVGHFEPTTAEIHFYNGMVGSAPILIIDTPGFCDARSDRSNDPKYVALIQRLVGEVDLFMFITRLDDSRVEGSELDTLKLLSDAFSKDLWKRTIVGLTRADTISRGRYQFHLNGRSQAIRNALREVAREETDSIPLVAISNEKIRTPDRKHWLPRLWLAMLQRMDSHGFESFVIATIDRIVPESEPSSTSDERTPSSPTTSSSAKHRSSRAHSSTTRSTRASNPTERSASPRLGKKKASDSPLQYRPSSSYGSELSQQAAQTQPASVAKAAPGLPALRPKQGLVVSTPVVEGRIIPPSTPSPSAPWAPDRPETSGSTPSVTIQRHNYIDHGTRITETRFEADRGVGSIVMSGGQLTLTQNVIQQRAPGLLKKLVSGAGKVASKVMQFLGLGLPSPSQ